MNRARTWKSHACDNRVAYLHVRDRTVNIRSSGLVLTVTSVTKRSVFTRWTEHCGSVIGTPDSLSGNPGFESQPRDGSQSLDVSFFLKSVKSSSSIHNPLTTQLNDLISHRQWPANCSFNCHIHRQNALLCASIIFCLLKVSILWWWNIR
jgi:hypothetical protein